MIPATCFRNKTVAVFGLGLTGRASARALAAGGAKVIVWDDNADACATARDEGLTVADFVADGLEGVDALLLSPGVPLTHPAPHAVVKAATSAGVEIIGDTEVLVRELAERFPETKLVAITGTNGKSTTTALIGHLLRHAGRAVQVGGNIGQAILGAEPPEPGSILVVEFSSYQIDLTPGLKPAVAILMNLSPDHLDRHGSMENYAAVKARIFARQGSGDCAVVGDDDHWSRAIGDALDGGQTVVRISGSHDLADGIATLDGRIRCFEAGARSELADISAVETLRGDHNGQNAAAAYAAVRALGLSRDEIVAGLSSFPGLAHRMEIVGRRGATVFVNDSKATNADAAARSLASFDRIYWIAGGRAKSGGIEPLAGLFPRVVKAYLIGEAAEQFAATLDGRVDHEICGVLEQAVARADADAARDAGGEAAVLLAPACASFDQYRSFEVRGDAFRRLVAGLEGVRVNEEVAA